MEYIYTLYQGNPQFATGIVVQPDMYTEDFEISVINCTSRYRTECYTEDNIT